MVKSSSSTPYCFVSGQTEKSKVASSSKYILTIRQQPQRAKVCGMKERDRRPIDPPPIVQIKLADPTSDRNKDYLQSPYLFMCCNLVHADDPSGEIVSPAHRALAGTVVSSLNRLKDVDNSDGGFFVFGDMSVRIEGRFCLRLTLLELIEGQVVHVMTTISNPLTVYSSKTFPGMSESTFLSRSFSDQGVRIRIRKDHHVKPKKPMSSDAMGDSVHSPPSSSHEAEHSDIDVDMHQPAKRSRSSAPSHDENAYQSHGYHSTRHVAIAARPKPIDARYSSSEPLERTPPSSPHIPLGQDSAPSRPRHNPYAPEESSRRYDGHPSSRQHPYYSSSRPSYYDSQPYYRHEHGAPAPYPPHPHSSYYPGSPRERAYSSEHRRPSYSVVPGYQHPSHEHGYYREGSPSYGYAPSYPMGAAHLSSPSSSSSSSVYNSSSRPSHYHHRSSTSSHYPHPSVHAGRHGFPAALLNDQEMEHAPAPAHSHGHHSHGHGHGQETYHSRTPSMSSQHSDSNFSPPPPFSPPESQMAVMQRGQSPVTPAAALPSIHSSRGGGGDKIQLPPIHTLSTHSPTMAPMHNATAEHHYYARP
ncbi:velvet factor-domain-containing protein [Dissophora ornata]|nr:hypothetical protein BGZ58_002324 [Dissophora ornata]KAI8595538.1 velvet factor-domain-containing protein [Dissophora ornata]